MRLIDNKPLPWLVGYIRASDDGRWVARRRENGEPIARFPRCSDAAAYLAIGGVRAMAAASNVSVSEQIRTLVEWGLEAAEAAP